MANQNQIPWASGPGEILRYGLDLLKKDTDTNRRLAMIAIDNSVELMVKTFLGLPKRVTGLAITRKEFQEVAESFPALLDALEKYAADRLDGIDLGTIEWYHRLRNQLYHQGNGLTVERNKVEIYAELANVLFRNLFGSDLMEHRSARSELIGEFMTAWVELEKGLRKLTDTLLQPGNTGTIPTNSMRLLERKGLIEHHEMNEIIGLRQIRNEVVHGAGNWETALTPQVIERVRYFAKRFGAEDAAQ
jgi:hypothetical protein